MNIVVTNITTAANFFHALRRQIAWPFRKPLIDFSPKANLRHPGSYSPMEEFTNGGFKEVIDDTFVEVSKVKTVLFCSGKIYFDLAEQQQKEKRKDVAIIRVEQLYPLPASTIRKFVYKIQEGHLVLGAGRAIEYGSSFISADEPEKH